MPKQEDLLWIKELSFRGEQKSLALVHTDLKQALKEIKSEKESAVGLQADAKVEDQHLADEALVLCKQPISLKDLTLRPAIQGKKTVGELQVHMNGFRFMTNKGVKIDIPFGNIQHAFFQPCEEVDIVVLLHFRLKAPILVGNKRHLDIQCLTEVMN